MADSLEHRQPCVCNDCWFVEIAPFTLEGEQMHARYWLTDEGKRLLGASG